MCSTGARVIVCVQPLTGAKRSRGRQALTPLADQRLEILKLSSGGARAVVKQEEMCVICEEVDGTLLHCTGPCLRVFHAKCIGLCVPPASATFTCDECLTGMVVHSSWLLFTVFLDSFYGQGYVTLEQSMFGLLCIDSTCPRWTRGAMYACLVKSFNAVIALVWII